MSDQLSEQIKNRYDNYDAESDLAVVDMAELWKWHEWARNLETTIDVLRAALGILADEDNYIPSMGWTGSEVAAHRIAQVALKQTNACEKGSFHKKG